MTENMKKFLEVLSAHGELKERANSAKTKEEVMELAKELGLTLTEADFMNADGKEMTEEELAAFTGGGGLCLVIGVDSTGCGCFIMGMSDDILGFTCFGLGT